jgi:hypothetical protein
MPERDLFVQSIDCIFAIRQMNSTREFGIWNSPRSVPQHEASPAGAADPVTEIVRRNPRVRTDPHLVERDAAAGAQP